MKPGGLTAATWLLSLAIYWPAFAASDILPPPGLDYRALEGDRIQNGQVVDPTRRPTPWMASLRRDGIHLCGATFIGPQVKDGILTWNDEITQPIWVITAAHCLFDEKRYVVKPHRLSILGGTLDIGEGAKKGEIQSVEEIILPSVANGGLELLPNARENDIALLRLSAPKKKLAQRRRTIRMPVGSERQKIVKPYASTFVTGWGRKYLRGPFSNKLLEVQVPIVDRSTCGVAYKSQGASLPPSVICAGFSTGEFDACKFDSGGPLFYRPTVFSSLSDAPLLIGVVSWGFGCGNPDSYGVYVDVGEYGWWLAEMIKRDAIRNLAKAN